MAQASDNEITCRGGHVVEAGQTLNAKGWCDLCLTDVRRGRAAGTTVQARASSAPSAVPGAQESVKSKVSPMGKELRPAFCTRCGAQFGDANDFCGKCGAPRRLAGSTVERDAQTRPREAMDRVMDGPKTPAKGGAFGKIVKGVFGIIGGLIVLGIVVSIFSPSGKSPSSDVGGEAVEVHTNAATLSADYGANEVAADEKYKGKIVEVDGLVDSIGKDITNTIYVTLSSGEEMAILDKPQLFFSDAHEKEAANLSRGQPLLAKCRCEGKFGNILLKNCVIEAAQTQN